MSKVCVAICNFNHENYLEESIKSIINQDYQDLDIVVIDDGSKKQDLVEEITKSFSDKRVRYIPIESNKGKWNALNVAFSTTDAVYCTAHDADDVSLPWRISSQLNVLTETKTLHNLCGFIHCWSENDIRLGYNHNRPINMKIFNKEDVLKAVSWGFQTPGVNHYFTGNFETAGVSSFFLKRIWDLGFRFLPPGMGIRILHSEDSDFNCRVTLSLNQTSILAETPYLYRRNTSTNQEQK